MNKKYFFCLIMLATATGLGVYANKVFSTSDLEYADDWTKEHVQLTINLGNNPFSFDKHVQRTLKNTLKKANECGQKIKDCVFSKNIAPPAFIIGESRISPFEAMQGWLAEEDARKILKIYGESPFEFCINREINIDDCIRQLEQTGYHPQRGVYDLSSPEYDLEGFSVPLKHSSTGYAILVKQGKIVRIRELRNYVQYLNAKKQKKEYTATGRFYCFLPNTKGTPVLSTSSSTQTAKDWPEQLISYAYIARNEAGSFSNQENRRQAIFRKVYLKDYNYIYEGFYWCYLSLCEDDREQIIQKYGKKPICISTSLRKSNQASIINLLEAAGYHPVATKNRDGFSFPIKDSPGGYKITFREHYTYISKLFNYKQYLRNQDSRDYTAEHNINRLYLPDPAGEHSGSNNKEK